jgi:GxxExxY protein
MNQQHPKVPQPIPPELESSGKKIVDAAFAVHSNLGPGLLENIYEMCLAHELAKRGLDVLRQVKLPVVYDGVQFEDGLRLDMLVQNAIIIEIKAVDTLLPVHKAQVLSYLRLSRHRLGFLINFHVPLIRDGIHRIVL